MTTAGAVRYGPAVPLEVKAAGAGDGRWEVEGYASVFGVRDLGDDVVERGAFAQTLRSGAKVRFLFSHDAAKVVGAPLALREDSHGLYFKGKISRTQLGQDVHTLVADGALDSFSIGYRPVDFELDPRAGIRRLKSLELLEVSLVSMPMLPAAQVTGFKAAAGARSVSPLVARLEAFVGTLRRKALIGGMTDAEARGYSQLLRWRVEGRVLEGR
jgi:HK97 family phage prohead protease